MSDRAKEYVGLKVLYRNMIRKRLNKTKRMAKARFNKMMSSMMSSALVDFAHHVTQDILSPNILTNLSERKKPANKIKRS